MRKKCIAGFWGMLKTFGQNSLALCTDPIQTCRVFAAGPLETTASHRSLAMASLMQISVPVSTIKQELHTIMNNHLVS